eukprot:CAMPEP_0113887322 /NCGR_PEP_ID=MMETSP0780_2-20120614/12145_1 /TAXON_ID=652834 /ORGANISM="Palpitomonas bilix" /LENGTH=84 /DNA_ID=CAMNT_0000875833 /DNA_START=122 /DNA_END=376 /DNA_ORIENTATION=- /assembly_acc=CAM_ASM_000599
MTGKPALEEGDVVKGANIFKNGSDPVLKGEKDYPAWLFALLEPAPALQQLSRNDLSTLSSKESERFFKLSNRQSIKEKNIQLAK